jgi:hypothetical protein
MTAAPLLTGVHFWRTYEAILRSIDTARALLMHLALTLWLMPSTVRTFADVELPDEVTPIAGFVPTLYSLLRSILGSRR